MLTKTKPLPYQEPQSFDDLTSYDPWELWAEYSPIAMQMPDDYDDYVVVG